MIEAIGEDQIVEKLLLNTWQPVAAIAAHAKLHHHTVTSILQRNSVCWNLQVTRSRLDGHNLVTLIRRKRPTMMVMGVTIPIEDDGEAGVD